MYIGILIGITIEGALLAIFNWPREVEDQRCIDARLIGTGMFIIGLCGALGWLTGA